MEIVGHCEIDPKCRSVIEKHWPDTPIHDDLTTLDGKEWYGKVDLVAGGTPCTDLSVAGRRAGLGGERSGIFWDFCRVADHSGAPWVLWENVAGALSSQRGEDFAAVLWGLTRFRPAVPKDGWRSSGVCVGPRRTAVWRLLDGRFFGVPQRRRRVFVVAGPRELCGPEVLVEPESLLGNPPPSAQAQQEVAGTLGDSSGSGSQANDHVIGGVPLIAFPLARRGRDGETHMEMGEAEVYNALRAGEGGSSHLNAVLVVSGPDGDTDVVAFGSKGSLADVSSDVAPTLRAGSHDKSHMNGGVMPAVVYAVSENQRAELRLTDYARQLVTGGGKPGSGYPAALIAELDEIGVRLVIRRLTPRECERLMSWPDDWTRWGADGKEVANSHRYKMCGNGVISNQSEWIARRLLAVASK
jgi:DNA (cytosine-5)-methyltransferase 1